jgi:hypothetical protein
MISVKNTSYVLWVMLVVCFDATLNFTVKNTEGKSYDAIFTSEIPGLTFEFIVHCTHLRSFLICMFILLRAEK